MKGIAKNPAVGVSVYTSPRISIVEFCTEGILCISGLTGGGYHDGLDGDDEPII